MNKGGGFARRLRINQISINMTDNTKNKEPRFKVGDVIYIASTNDRLYCSLAYGLYKGVVKRVYKDVYQSCPFDEQSQSIEWHYESTLNPFVGDVCEPRFILTQKEFKECAVASGYFGHPYYRIDNQLFKVIK